jgi:regulatory factor X
VLQVLRQLIQFKDCGIRPSTSAEAEYLQEYIRKSNNTAAQQSVNAARLANDGIKAEGSDEEDDEDSEGLSAPPSKRSSLILPKDSPAFTLDDGMAEKTPTAATLLSHHQAQASQQRAGMNGYAPIRRRGTTPQDGLGQQQQHQQQQMAAAPAFTPAPNGSHSGGASANGGFSVRQLPHFPSIEDAVGTTSASAHGLAARELWAWFIDHLDGLLDAIRAFRFDQFEIAVRTFWASLGPAHREVAHAPAVAGLMAKADAIVYDEVLEILRSQMLSHIPPQALQSLRQLAMKMEHVLLVALEQYGNTFVEPKVELGARFGHLVRE